MKAHLYQPCTKRGTSLHNPMAHCGIIGCGEPPAAEIHNIIEPKSASEPASQATPVVWSLPAGKAGMPMSETDEGGIITACVRKGIWGYVENYFLTESAALDALRKHAKEQEQKWYALIRLIDARVDEIEIADQVG